MVHGDRNQFFPVSVPEVSRNRESGAIELVDQEAVTAGKLLSLLADGVREIDALLVDLELLKAERHLVVPG